jgi:GNAT superfamily N-acetyltransferase
MSIIVLAADALRSRGTEAITACFDGAYLRDFEAVGFYRAFARVRMEAATGARPHAGVVLKPPEEGEILGLARFFMGIYEGQIQQLYGMHVGSAEDWRSYVTGILRGETGRFMPDASFVALEETRLVGAILMSQWMRSPLVAELGVAKDQRRYGIAHALLSAASTRLAWVGESR